MNVGRRAQPPIEIPKSNTYLFSCQHYLLQMPSLEQQSLPFTSHGGEKNLYLPDTAELSMVHLAGNTFPAWIKCLHPNIALHLLCQHIHSCSFWPLMCTETFYFTPLSIWTMICHIKAHFLYLKQCSQHRLIVMAAYYLMCLHGWHEVPAGS